MSYYYCFNLSIICLIIILFTYFFFGNCLLKFYLQTTALMFYLFIYIVILTLFESLNSLNQQKKDYKYIFTYIL